MTPFAFLVASLAVGQAVRLIVLDKAPFGRLQRWLKEMYEGAWFQVLLSCPWCISGWLSLAALGALEWRYEVPLPALVWFAVWRVALASFWAVELTAKYGAAAEPPPHLDLDDDDFS